MAINPYLEELGGDVQPVARRAPNPYLDDTSLPELGADIRLQPVSVAGILGEIERDSGPLPPEVRGELGDAIATGRFDFAMPRAALGETGPSPHLARGHAPQRPRAPLGEPAPDRWHDAVLQPKGIGSALGLGTPTQPFEPVPGIPDDIYLKAIPNGAWYRDGTGGIRQRESTLGEQALSAFTRVPAAASNVVQLLGDAVDPLAHKLEDLTGLPAGGGATDAIVGAGNQFAELGATRPANTDVQDLKRDPLGNVLPFIGEQTLASSGDMAMAVAALPAYIAARTQEIGEQRALNDLRTRTDVPDYIAALPAAVIESVLEKYTTGRLLPGRMPVAGSIPGRLAQETAVQSSLGGVEEGVANLGEELGTVKGADAHRLFDSILGGVVTEGGLGGAVQVAKEVHGAATRPAPIPPAPLGQAPESAPLGETARPSPPTAIAPAGQTLPEAAAAPLGEAQPARAPVGPTLVAGEAPRAPAPVQELGEASPPRSDAQFVDQVAQARAATELAARDESAPVVGAAPVGDGVSVSPAAAPDQQQDEAERQLHYNPPPGTVVGGPKEIRALAARAKSIAAGVREAVRYAVVSSDVATRIREVIGVDVSLYRHTVDAMAMKHAMSQHGHASEQSRGQLPVTEADFERIPEIVANPDLVEAAGVDAKNRPLIRYTKRFNGTTYYVEEVRKGRRELAAKTMWKAPSRAPMPGETIPGATSEPAGGNLPGTYVTPPAAEGNEPQASALQDQPEAGAATTPAPAAAPAAAEPVDQPAANAPRLPATSTKNAVTDAERAEAGKDPVLRELAKSNESTLAEAQAAIAANPSRGAEVVERLRSDGTSGISLADEAVLLVEKTRLRNQRDAAAARASDPAASEEARAVAKREFEETEGRINEMDQATHATGREWGRLGQFRQRMLREDFTFEALERRERVREGRPLTMEESAKLKQFAERIQELEGQAEVARTKLEEANAHVGTALAYKSLVKEMAKALNVEQKGRPRLERLKTSADESRAALRKMLGRTNAGVDPTAFFHLARIGAYHVANGAVKFADWVVQMKADIGAKMFGEVEPALPDVFKAAQGLGRKAVGKSPTEVLAGVDATDIAHRDVVELARAHILAGVQGEGAVMKAVHDDLVTISPEITEREVRRLFADYGKVQFPSKDADKVALRELRALVQLQESIDRLAEGRDALKSGPQRDKATQAIREKRKALEVLLRKQEKSNAPSPEKLATYQQARAENLRHQIEDLEKQLATGERPPKPDPPAASEEVKALTVERDALRKQLDAIDRPAMSPEERYQRGRASSIKRQLEQVQARLAAGDYAHRSRPEPKALNEANTKAALALAKVKEEFARHQFESDMAKRHPLRKIFGAAAETLNLARAILTSIDLSAVLRQGGFIGLGHPVRAAKSIGPMLQAFASEKGEFRVNREIEQRENFPLYKKFGLELTQVDAKQTWSKMEEAYMSRWIDRIPAAVGGGLIRGSARSFTTFMNKLRADSFDAMVYALSRNGQQLSIDEGRAIANYINVATGRGNLNPLEPYAAPNRAAAYLNTVFFAPRLVASRFNLLAGQPLYGGSNRTRALVAQEYARFLMGVGVVFALAAAAADEDDEPLVTTDPRSTNFLKMRFGKTYVDPMVGLSQVTVFLARELSGEKVTTGSDLVPGKVVPLRKDLTWSEVVEGKQPGKAPFGAEDGVDVATRFLRTKLAPVPGAIASTLSGKDVTGNAVTLADTARSMVVPMSLQSVREIMTDNGMPKGSAIMLLNLLGMGVQYRESRRTTAQEVEAFTKLPLLEKLKAFDNADPSDRLANNLRGEILSSDWQAQVAKLPEDERAAALKQIDQVRASEDVADASIRWNPDSEPSERKPAPSGPSAAVEFDQHQRKAKISAAEKEIRAAFDAGGEEGARKALEAQRELLGPEVDLNVDYDDEGKPKLVLHGLKARRDAVMNETLNVSATQP